MIWSIYLAEPAEVFYEGLEEESGEVGEGSAWVQHA